MNKIETLQREKFYKQQSMEGNIIESLMATREEPGLSIQDVANILKRVFCKEEIESLINNLKK